MNIEDLAKQYLQKNGSYAGCGLYEITVSNAIEFAKLVEQETLERAAKVCESWRGGKLLLNAGEMSGDELRTVRAVTDAAGREIRALKGVV